MEPLILASASPRRREICDLLGLTYEVIPAVGEESLDPSLPLTEAVMRVARAKAEEVATSHPDRVAIGADTTVAVDGRPLGKPCDEADAAAMLRSLQGRWHQVLTGVWICAPDGGKGFVSCADVCFYPMTEEEIAAYIATGEPMDKAGAYGIQGKGMRFVKEIRGDFYAVMGLPGAELYQHLRALPVADTASSAPLTTTLNKR